MLFKLSNLNSNHFLTLGYLNPVLNNSAQLQMYFSHCTLSPYSFACDCHSPLNKSCQQNKTMLKTWRNNFEWKGGLGGQHYISQTCDQHRFEVREVAFLLECLNNFATGCSFSVNPLDILSGKKYGWTSCLFLVLNEK